MTYTSWPLRFSADPAAMIDFLAALGLNQTISHAAGRYAVFDGRGGRIGVHDAATAGDPTPGRTSLNLMADDLQAAADELRAAGLAVQAWDEAYGKQGVVTSPDGRLVGLNEATQEDLYGGYQLHDQIVAASMDVVAIGTVADVQREADFLAHFGFAAIESGEGYLPLTAGPRSGVIGLRTGPPSATTGTDEISPPYLVELGFETSEPLDALADRLRAGGYEAPVITDDTGVWVRITDPDGVTVEVRPTR